MLLNLNHSLFVELASCNTRTTNLAAIVIWDCRMKGTHTLNLRLRIMASWNSWYGIRSGRQPGLYFAMPAQGQALRCRTGWGGGGVLTQEEYYAVPVACWGVCYVPSIPGAPFTTRCSSYGFRNRRICTLCLAFT
jgi:hypothetical protein